MSSITPSLSSSSSPTAHTAIDGIRNGSEPGIPNRSEPRSGRPALVSDDALLDIARRLNRQLGRPPRADELINESGGCQRARALNAIRTLKLEVAQGAVQSQLSFAPEIESGLRQLMGRWQEHAATQLAQRHLDLTEQFESRESAQRALLEEHEATVAVLTENLRLRESRISRLTEKLERLEADYRVLKDQHIEVRSLATERLRLIRQWKRTPSLSNAPASLEDKS